MCVQFAKSFLNFFRKKEKRNELFFHCFQFIFQSVLFHSSRAIRKQKKNWQQRFHDIWNWSLQSLRIDSTAISNLSICANEMIKQSTFVAFVVFSCFSIFLTNISLDSFRRHQSWCDQSTNSVSSHIIQRNFSESSTNKMKKKLFVFFLLFFADLSKIRQITNSCLKIFSVNNLWNLSFFLRRNR